jgi:sugar phosphate isomerase/epimerase
MKAQGMSFLEKESANKPQLGFNMHPKWLRDSTASEFLSPLRVLGLNILEFTLNLCSPDWPEFSSLIEECRRLGFRASFHAPYKDPYNVAGFSGAKRKEIESLYWPAIEYAARIAGDTVQSTTLVVHGARGDRPRGELRRDTEAFLSWILDEVPSLCLSLELLFREQDRAKIGDNKVELVEIVSGFASPRVGICWDLGHGTRNIMGGGDPAIPAGFIPSVSHVHLHDIAPNGEDHCPLLFGNVPYEKHLRQLVGAGYRKAVILEVNGYLVSRFAAAKGVPPSQILWDNFRELGGLTSSRRLI